MVAELKWIGIFLTTISHGINTNPHNHKINWDPNLGNPLYKDR